MATDADWRVIRSLTNSDAHGHTAPHLSILLVEDHDDTLKVTSRLLRLKNYQVKTARTVRDALLAAAHEGFDLIISDVSLPDGSGLDLVRQLQDAGPIKAIAVTGHASPADIEASLSAGFCAHLTKPLNFHQLESVIADCTRDLRIIPAPFSESFEVLPRTAI